MAAYTDSDLRLWGQVTQWAILGANVRRRRAVRYAGLEFAVVLVICIALGQWLFQAFDLYTPKYGMALGALIGAVIGGFLAADEFRSKNPSTYEFTRLATAMERLTELRGGAGSLRPESSPGKPGPETPLTHP